MICTNGNIFLKTVWTTSLALALAFPQILSANTRGVVTAVAVKKAPLINGILSEWKAPFVHVSVDKPAWFMGKSRIFGTPVKDSKDIEVWYAMTWKGDKLFFAAIVLDNVITKNTSDNLGNAWNRDSVELYFAFNHDAPYFTEARTIPYRTDQFQIRLIPFEKEKGIKGGVYLGAHAADLTEVKFQNAVKFASGPYSQGGRNGYVLEASFDLTELGFPGILKTGRVIGFDLAVNDSDSEKNRDRMLTWSSFGNRGYQDSSCFGELVLANSKGTFAPPANAASEEKEGYYLLPGTPVLQTAAQSLEKPQADDSAGRVVYAENPPSGAPESPRGAMNISGMFDPNPYRPINKPEIRYCQVGYLPDGKKVAYLEMPAGEKPSSNVFYITKAGEEVYSGMLKKWGTLWMRDYYYLDFNEFKGSGKGFALSAAGKKTEPFPIGENIYDAAVSMAFSGVFLAEKCGVDAGIFHGPCHLDDAIQYPAGEVRSNQKLLTFLPVFAPKTALDVSGGWHDAGDFNKYMGNAPHGLVYFLLVEQEFQPKVGLDEKGRNFFVRDAEYTADWCMKMQDKDGGVFERVWSGFGHNTAPEKETDNKPGTGDERPLDTDKWSNVTARWVAAAAVGAQVLLKADPAYAEKLKASALKGWEYVENCPAQPNQPWEFGVYPGNESCVFWAAVELYRLTKSIKFLQESLKRLPAMVDMAPKFMGWGGNNTIALIRLYPVLPDGPDKDKVRAKLLGIVKDMAKEEVRNPFGVEYAPITGWGNNGDLMGNAMTLYLIQQIIPESNAIASLESYRQWMYGCNPAGYSFVVGLGSKQVLHQFTGLKKNMPGALVPGIVDDGSGMPFYVDSDASYVNNEAGPDSSTQNLFVGYAKASWKKPLATQDRAIEKIEYQKATAKAEKPDPNLLVDFKLLAPDSVWSGGGGGWSFKKSIVDSAPGGAKAYRGEFRVGEWCTSVIPTGGNLSSYSGISCLVRGNDCRLRLAIDDANGEDWGKEVTAPAEWKAVTLFFNELIQPSWTIEKDKLPLDVGGIQKFKIQAMSPAEGWYEIAEIRKASGKAPSGGASGLLKLCEGDEKAVWTGGGGAYKIEKNIEEGSRLHVKYTIGEWCMVGVTGQYKAADYKGFKFKANGAGVNLRVAVQDGKNHDFGKAITLTDSLADYTVLFSDMVRASWENESKDAALDLSVLTQIKLQPTAPSTSEFWISEIEFIK